MIHSIGTEKESVIVNLAIKTVVNILFKCDVNKRKNTIFYPLVVNVTYDVIIDSNGKKSNILKWLPIHVSRNKH